MTTFFTPTQFKAFPMVVAGHSLRVPELPGENSMLPSSCSEEIAAQNRAAFAQELGGDQLYVPKLTHGKVIYELTDDYTFATRPEADAIITDQPHKLLGIGVADCIVVLLFDPATHAIAAIHSGWRGTSVNITGATITGMTERYTTNPADLVAYMSPSPTRFEYGIPNETAALFNEKYSSPKTDHDRWLDNKLAVYDQLVAAGVSPTNIQTDPRTNIAPEFHSFRRDREHSGRHMVVIGLRD